MSDSGAPRPSRPGPEHERLAPFVGRWRTEGQVLATASAPAAEIIGTDSYEWVPGRFFLLHRVHVRIGGERVEAVEIIGWDGAGGRYFAHSFDSRGDAVTMHAVERDGVWTFTGDAERFTGGFGDGGETLSGTWERREDSRWRPWMEVRLTRIGESSGS